MKCIIHIGHGKTGSSAIQSYLAGVSDELEAIGFSYPYHYSFEKAKEGGISSGNGNLIFAKGFKVASNTILSNEVLFHKLRSREALGNLIGKVGFPPTLICYTRDVFDHAVSSWGQLVKRAHYKDEVDSYLKVCGGYLGWLIEYFDLCAELGIELVVRNYSRHENELVADFIRQVLGKQATALLHANPPAQRRVNRSLTMAEYRIQMLFNRYLDQPSGSWISDPLVDELPEIASEIPFISREVYEDVTSRLSQDVARVNRHLDPGEAIILERYEDIIADPRMQMEDRFSLSAEQLDVLVRNISNEINRLGKGGADGPETVLSQAGEIWRRLQRKLGRRR